MTSHQRAVLTHWCRNCDAHHALRHTQQSLHAPTTPSGEVEVLICPHCGSFEVEKLQEFDDAQ